MRVRCGSDAESVATVDGGFSCAFRTVVVVVEQYLVRWPGKGFAGKEGHLALAPKSRMYDLKAHMGCFDSC
jgi:hypothetical protein